MLAYNCLRVICDIELRAHVAPNTKLVWVAKLT
jgi:hypothetical protein